MKKILMGILVLLMSVVMYGAEVKDKTLMMATTTSTADTGLLDYLAPIFKEDTGITLEYNSVGTGEAISMGKNGDVDIILVHAKASEEKFVAEGYGIERFEVMYNDFIVIGPKNALAYNNNIEDTFKKVVNEKISWISRGDNSGTHKKEKELWKKFSIDPSTNPNYVESGSGMGATINMADEKQALTLTDRGTYLKMKNDASIKIELDIICEKDAGLLNQYGIIAVNPAKYPETNIEAANVFINWICSEKIQKLIGEFGTDRYGQPLFFPNAKKRG